MQQCLKIRQYLETDSFIKTIIKLEFEKKNVLLIFHIFRGNNLIRYLKEIFTYPKMNIPGWFYSSLAQIDLEHYFQKCQCWFNEKEYPLFQQNKDKRKLEQGCTETNFHEMEINIFKFGRITAA